MAVWPFGRRAAREADAAAARGDGTARAIPYSQSATALARKGSGGKKSRRQGRRASSPTATSGAANLKAHLEPIAPVSLMGASFPRRTRRRGSQDSAEDITALPHSKVLSTSPHLRPLTKGTADIPYDFRLYSSSSRLENRSPPGSSTPPTIQKHRLSRTPSGKKRNADQISGKLNKKQRNANPIREEEIRAMSAPSVALPRHSFRGDLGILERDSKQIRDGLNRNFERPLSNISLPRNDSSSTHRVKNGSSGDGRMYRIRVTDMFAPRPFLKASEPYSLVALGEEEIPRRFTTRKAGSNHSKENARKRSDDLADDLDASELRAAMERDKRRREQRRERQAARLQKHLERKAAKARAAEEAEHAEGGNKDSALRALGGTPAAVASQQRRERRDRSGSRKSSRRSSRESERDWTGPRSRSSRERLPEAERLATASPPPAVPDFPTPQAHDEPLMGTPNIDLDDAPAANVALARSSEQRERTPLMSEDPDSLFGIAPSSQFDTRFTPLMPDDTEEIPGLPFLSSEGSDVESTVASPFGTFSSDIHHSDELAAPPPVVHKDPRNYSTLSPAISNREHYPSEAAITALPDVSEKAAERKSPRKPSRFFSIFRRGDKRKGRARTVSDTTAGHSDLGTAVSNQPSELSSPPPGSAAPMSSEQAAAIANLSRAESQLRKRSIFKEELGLNIAHVDSGAAPLSPPPSRIHSASSQNAPAVDHHHHHRGAVVTPISHHRISEQYALEHDPDEDSYPANAGRGSNPHTHSLASVDSEGSWLTGRALKRGASSRMRSPALSHRASGSHVDMHAQRSNRSSSDETMSPVVEDHAHHHTYHQTHLSPTIISSASPLARSPIMANLDAASPFLARSVSNEGMRAGSGALPAGEGTTYKVHSDLARTPTVKRAIRVKSSEGILRDMLKSHEALGSSGGGDIKALEAAAAKDKELAQQAEDSDTSHDEDYEHEHEHALMMPSELHRARSIQASRHLGEDAKLVEVGGARRSGSPDRGGVKKMDAYVAQ